MVLLGYTDESFFVYDPNRRNFIRMLPVTELAVGLKPLGFYTIVITPKGRKKRLVEYKTLEEFFKLEGE